VGRIIAKIFDDTTNAFIDAIEQSLPHLSRATIIWRSQFLLGALYYTLINPDRVSRLSRGVADGSNIAEGIEQLVASTVVSLQAPDVSTHRNETISRIRKVPRSPKPASGAAVLATRRSAVTAVRPR
jgi:hypothetical protein